MTSGAPASPTWRSSSRVARRMPPGTTRAPRHSLTRTPRPPGPASRTPPHRSIPICGSARCTTLACWRCSRPTTTPRAATRIWPTPSARTGKPCCCDRVTARRNGTSSSRSGTAVAAARTRRRPVGVEAADPRAAEPAAAVGGPVRTMTRELRLKTQRPGTLVIGPVRVRQGPREITTPPLTVTVDSAATGLATAVSPLARRLIAAAPPPAHNDRVALSLILPGDSVLVGQQLDVIAAAWFPRELRIRLAYPPILSLQTAEGAWSYPGAVPADVAASRQVRGEWMDLFVAHQALFPLAPGRIVIPPATVAYAVPVGFSVFKREERYSLHSDTVPVTVLPLPATRRPADDQPVAAQGLALDLALDPPSSRVG